MSDLLGAALMRKVEAHVQQTGHRSIYGTTWPEDGRVGFSCEDCEKEHTFFQTWTDKAHLEAGSIVWKLHGAANRQALEGWVAAVRVRGAWELLIDDKFDDGPV